VGAQRKAARSAAETVEKMARELNEIQYEARADKAHGAAVAAVLGKAKVLNIGAEQQHQLTDFQQAKSMQDIGRKLLQSIGFASPDDVSIAAAIHANDAFIARLETIRDSAQGRTINLQCVDGHKTAIHQAQVLEGQANQPRFRRQI
jgi:hypothetical protein